MSWIKKSSLVLVQIAITLIFLEGGSALILYFKGNSAGAVQSEFVFRQVDSKGIILPSKDYVLPTRQNAKFQWTSPEFSVEVRTNSKGFREDFDFSLENIEVAFFGDSFTFGHGVEVNDRYTNIYASKLPSSKEKIASFSYVNGFQPEHYEYFFRNHPELKPKKVVIGLYLGNDFGADILATEYNPKTNEIAFPYRRIFAVGQLGNVPSAFKFPFDYLADKSSFAKLFLQVIGRTSFRSILFKEGFEGSNAPNSTSLEKGEEDILNNRATQSLIRMNDLVKSRGGQLTILIIPQNYFFGDLNPHVNRELVDKVVQLRIGKSLLTEFLTICKKSQLDCFDSRPFLSRESYFSADAHWNISGHKSVAEALFKHLSNK